MIKGLLIAALILAGLAQAADAMADAAIDTAIQQLASPDFDVRQKAAAQLLKAGESCRAAMLKAVRAGDADAETRARINGILQTLDAAVVNAERLLNEKAYTTEYVPIQERIKSKLKEKWIVIVDGKLLFVGEDGLPLASNSIEAADAAALKAAPNARHRFIFKVGDEGNQECPLGGCEKRLVMGNTFAAEVSPGGVLFGGPDGLQFNRVAGSDKWVSVGVKLAGDDRSYLRPAMLAPGGTTELEGTFCMSTGFGGKAVMPSDFAAQLRLELWEIPGEATLKGEGDNGGACRRAYARIKIKQVNDTWLMPVYVWKDDEKK